MSRQEELLLLKAGALGIILSGNYSICLTARLITALHVGARKARGQLPFLI